MPHVVREPAIIAGRLRLRGEVISGEESALIEQSSHLQRSCVRIPEAEVTAPRRASTKPIQTKEVED